MRQGVRLLYILFYSSTKVFITGSHNTVMYRYIYIYISHISFHKGFEMFCKPQAKLKAHINKKNPHKIMKHKHDLKIRTQE